MNKKAQATMEFLMTYGWAFLVIILVLGTLIYFRPSISYNMFEDKAKDSTTAYINSVRNSTDNRLNKIDDEIYVLNDEVKKIKELEIWIKDVQRQRLLQWMIENNYTNTTYPDHIGKDESAYVYAVESTYVRINFREDKYALQMYSDNTFECFEKSPLKWNKIECEDTKPKEEVENA